MAYVGAVLCELQNRASPFSKRVWSRGGTRSSHGPGPDTSRARGPGRIGGFHRWHVLGGQGWRCRYRPQQAKRGKGVRVMGIVDGNGLPLSVSTHAANHHEVTLVQLTFDFYLIEDQPDNLIGDKAYDSDSLDEERKKDGIEMIAPHRQNRTKKKTQDGRRVRRWMVERFFAWLQWQRRVITRWELYPENFLGFVQLASILILLKQFQF